MRNMCNDLVEQFIKICGEINFPVSQEKTEWATQVIVFLGMLLNTVTQTISILMDKHEKATNLLKYALKKQTVTVLKIQQSAGWNIMSTQSLD